MIPLKKIRVTIWNEYLHEPVEEAAHALYPDGIHNFIKDFLKDDENLEIRTCVLDDEDYGLSDEILENTDVLIFWAHIAHGRIPDEVAMKIRERVYNGMGFIPLHSAHKSKPFMYTVGCNGNLTWGDEVKEIIFNTAPSHPIAKGIPEHFIIDREEMYGEYFSIPQPDSVVFTSWFESGYVFRSGCCFLRGVGKVFYFQPGHETSASFYNEYVQKIIRNAIYWTAPTEMGVDKSDCRYATAL